MKTANFSRLFNIMAIVLLIVAFGVTLAIVGFPPVGIPVMLGLSTLVSMILLNSVRNVGLE